MRHERPQAGAHAPRQLSQRRYLPTLRREHPDAAYKWCAKCKQHMRRAQQRRYYAANREKARRYRAENYERIRAPERRYRAANRERINASSRRYHAANREKAKANDQ